MEAEEGGGLQINGTPHKTRIKPGEFTETTRAIQKFFCIALFLWSTEVALSFLVWDAMSIMEEIAPSRFAESWDPAGLQIGNPKAPVGKIAFALDATLEIVRSAIEKKVDLLITHHPLFFTPLKKIDLSTPMGNLAGEAIRGGLAIYAAHTNLDSAPGGLNDTLCEKLGLENTKVLSDEKEEDLHMLLLEVPQKNHEGFLAVSDSMGHRFSWWHDAERKAMLGRAFVAHSKRAELEREIRTFFDDCEINWLPAGKRSAGAGLGRIGILPEAIPLKALAIKLKEILGISHVRLVGEGKKQVRNLAICSGSGASLIPAALAGKADCLLTGDVKYHEAMTALDHGLLLLDAGHFGTEHLVVELLLKAFEEKLHKKKKFNIHLMGLEGSDPFETI